MKYWRTLPTVRVKPSCSTVLRGTWNTRRKCEAEGTQFLRFLHIRPHNHNLFVCVYAIITPVEKLWKFQNFASFIQNFAKLQKLRFVSKTILNEILQLTKFKKSKNFPAGHQKISVNELKFRKSFAKILQKTCKTSQIQKSVSVLLVTRDVLPF